MANYAIGDIQGCLKPLEKLLTLIRFSAHDSLWFTGDLVNRGPHSLEVLRFVKQLGPKHYVVLGNHDLHLLAVAYGVQPTRPEDTIHPILKAPDCDHLIDWLRQQSLLVHQINYVMTHAGLAPAWDLTTAKMLAQEVEQILRSKNCKNFLKQMYGNQPDLWDANLVGMDRLRCITNYLTRMRFCDKDGRLDFYYKGEITDKPAHLYPWFMLPNRSNAKLNIIFGHWAALEGQANTPHIFPLDTGCVWGNCLTAMRLEDQAYFKVKCNI